MNTNKEVTVDPSVLIAILREQVAELTFALAVQHARYRQLSPDNETAPPIESA